MNVCWGCEIVPFNPENLNFVEVSYNLGRNILEL